MKRLQDRPIHMGTIAVELLVGQLHGADELTFLRMLELPHFKAYMEYIDYANDTYFDNEGHFMSPSDWYQEEYQNYAQEVMSYVY